jgi:hypothetical protein
VLRLVFLANTRPVTIDKHGGALHKLGVRLANDGERVAVVGLEPRSIAAEQLRLGETILSVDGTLVHHHADACALLDANDGRLQILLGPPVDDLQAVLSAISCGATALPRSVRGKKGYPLFERHEANFTNLQPLCEANHGFM